MIGIKKEAAATGWVQVAREREPYRRGAMISAGRVALPRNLNPRPITCSFV